MSDLIHFPGHVERIACAIQGHPVNEKPFCTRCGATVNTFAWHHPRLVAIGQLVSDVPILHDYIRIICEWPSARR